MGILNDSFSVTGGDTVAPPSGAKASERFIKFRPLKFLPDFSVSSEDNPLDPNYVSSVSSEDTWTNGQQKVWLVIPGFTANTNGLNDIGKVIRKANPEDAIIALDWTQASNTSVNNPGLGVLNGGLYRAGSWITPVANGIRDKLISWGMQPEALNIVGHSLGAHLAGEIGASFNSYVGTGGGPVGSVTALDPASNRTRNRSPYDKDNGYDTDLSNGYIENGGTADPIKGLDIGATVSRSFNGMSSLSGNESQSGTAKESFLFDFGNNASANPLAQKAQLDEHSRVITAYNNLITTTPITDPITGVVTQNSRLATNILGVNDTLADHQFRPDFYKGNYNESPQVHEAVIPVDKDNNPLFLVAAKLNGGIDDRFIYGTNSDDKFDSSLPFSLAVPFSKYYNNNGNHTYYLGNGKDSVLAGTGNDTIYGGIGDDDLKGGDGDNNILGEEDNDFISTGIGNDILDGGAGNDQIYSGAGNDYIFGKAGDNQLFGEADNDHIYGGNNKDIIYGGAGNDEIFGGGGENTMYGEAGEDTLVGGSGVNRLRGGLGNDILQSNGINNSLRGSETNWLSEDELDILIGTSRNGAFDSFWIGDETTNWYSSALFNDYAEIQNFDPAIDRISGGVNISAVNNPLTNQTFLASGIELIAKIDGLWVGNPHFQFSSI